MIPAIANAPAPKRPPPADSTTPVPLDDTADPFPSAGAPPVDEAARRTAGLLAAERERDQRRELELDRMRADFDFDQVRRAETLREMNAMRDLAMEQMKRDNEILKKWIASI